MSHLDPTAALQLGRYNRLQILRHVKEGILLDGRDENEVLLLSHDVPKNQPVDEGDWLDLFLYLDGRNRLIGTTKRPYAQVGEFADLQVAEINDIGIFLNWGLPKDVMLPYSEEVVELRKGEYSIVYLYLDRMNRITATAKIEQHLDQKPHTYNVGDRIKMLIAERTEMGYKVIINDAHWGLVHKNELFKEIKIGAKEIGFIKNIRPDNKIDVSLQPTETNAREKLEDLIMRRLSEHGGVLPISDKSPPHEINKMFGVSKATFKRAIGGLYRDKLITIEPTRILRVEKL